MNYTRRSANENGSNVAEIANNGHHVEFGAIWNPTSTSSASWSIGPIDISWKADTSSSGSGEGEGGFNSSLIFTGTAFTAGAAAIIASMAFCLA